MYDVFSSLSALQTQKEAMQFVMQDYALQTAWLIYFYIHSLPWRQCSRCRASNVS